MNDFIELYENSLMEKENLGKRFGFKGPMREESDQEIVEAALEITLRSRSVFSVNLIFDLLNMGGLLEGDPYLYRVNTPGTVSDKNWSLKLPIPLENLLKNNVNKKLKTLLAASGRA